jgi:hypothetical protein
MRSNHKNANVKQLTRTATTASRSVRKVAKRAAKQAGTALAVVSNRLQHDAPRAMKHAGVALNRFSNRAKRSVKRNPGRVLLGAAAIGFLVAKLSRLFA